jgi:O-antigen ligase
MCLDHPFFGVGHGAYRKAIAPYATSDLPDVILNLHSQAHNLFLHTLSETGLVGLAGFLVVVAVALGRVIKRLRLAEDSTKPNIDQAAYLCVLILLIIGLLHFVLYHNPVALVFWYCLGICAGPWALKPPKKIQTAP